MKPILKKVGWIIVVILGCKVGVQAHEPKFTIKAYKNTIIGIIEEQTKEGYILSLALGNTPVICNEISNSYEESLNPHIRRYFLPLTLPITKFLKNQLLHLEDSFQDCGYCIKISFAQYPIPGILLEVTLDSKYTIEKNINSSTRQVSFVIKK